MDEADFAQLISLDPNVHKMSTACSLHLVCVCGQVTPVPSPKLERNGVVPPWSICNIEDRLDCASPIACQTANEALAMLGL